MDGETPVHVIVPLALLLCVSAANATPVVRYEFSGVVSSVDAPLQGEFALGEEFHLVLEFDASEPNVSLNPIFGRYQNGVLITAEIGDYAVTSSDVFIDVFNDNSGSDIVKFLVSNLSGPNVGGVPPLSLAARLTDSTESALADNGLPTSLSATDFADLSADLSFKYLDGNGATVVEKVVSTLHSINASQIPEPTTGLLLGVGLASLAAARRRR